MIESLLHSLAGWPPAVVYALIFVSCLVENFFPPAPSDLFVVMAGFLSHTGSYQPVTIFATAWAGGLVGSIAVYLVVARFAERFIASRIGKVVLHPEPLAFLLKEYGRYGGAGLFITRLLPGFRSVVAPFSGLNKIGFWRVMIPVGLASAIWYAVITWIGTRLGDEWDTVIRVLNALNQTLGATAGVVVIALVIGFVLWRRRRRAA